mmetsp:Transcript_21976/g.35249  ORF Transcript_21976/g.35249 Transcript_21976/m.35249 type:complete len:264 (+) Transcript_21976:2306-3097(+)
MTAESGVTVASSGASSGRTSPEATRTPSTRHSPLLRVSSQLAASCSCCCCRVMALRIFSGAGLTASSALRFALAFPPGFVTSRAIIFIWPARLGRATSAEIASPGSTFWPCSSANSRSASSYLSSRTADRSWCKRVAPTLFEILVLFCCSCKAAFASSDCFLAFFATASKAACLLRNTSPFPGPVTLITFPSLPSFTPQPSGSFHSAASALACSTRARSSSLCFPAANAWTLGGGNSPSLCRAQKSANFETALSLIDLSSPLV